MDEIFRCENRKFVIPYLDDIIIYSNSIEEHRTHLGIVLGKIKGAGLSLNESKCRFFKTEIKILGCTIREGKIEIDKERLEAITKYPVPTNIREVRSFLGMANFCRDFVVNFAEATAPLYDLLRGEKKSSSKKVTMNNKQEEAFVKIKNLIKKSSTRHQPDFNEKFILTTDASNTGIGAILSQINKSGQEVMISAFSKTLDKCQMNYSVTDKELLGIIKGISHFRHYLLGTKFLLRTDHKALTFMNSTTNTNGRLLRWGLILSEYSFDLQYIKGEENVADGLSRIKPSPTIANISSEELHASDKDKILKEYHISTGHGSSNTMKFILNGRYNWKGLNKDIEKYVQSCEICTKSSGPIICSKNRVILTERPNQLWEVDLIGKINEIGGPKYIFIAIDHYGKWVETQVLKDKTGEMIAEAVYNNIIKKHGIPERILSDSGLEFENKHVQNLAINNNIKWEFGSPYHHQTTGAVERANQTLRNILRKLTNFGRIKWSSILEKATLAMNLSFNRSIGTSPYLLKHGSLPVLEVDKEFGISNKKIPMDILIQKRNRNFHRYKSSIVKGNLDRSKEIEIGSKVLAYRDHPNNTKMDTNWLGGFLVRGKSSIDAYIVENTKNGKKMRLNKRHIRKDMSSS